MVGQTVVLIEWLFQRATQFYCWYSYYLDIASSVEITDSAYSMIYKYDIV